MMRALVFALGTLFLASTAGAQMPARGGGQTIGLAASLQRAYAGVKQNLTDAAEKMPAEDYGTGPRRRFARTADSSATSPTRSSAPAPR